MDETTTSTTDVKEKHGLIDEIKDGLHAIEAFEEEVIDKIEAFFSMKKLQVTQQATGETAVSNDEIVSAVNDAQQADDAEAAASKPAPTPTPAADSTTQATDSAVGTAATDPAQPAA